MAIIGNGDIAKALSEVPKFVIDPNITFMASGLSNSTNVTYADYKREVDLIYRYDHRHLVYFSSLSVYYSKSEYATYKKDIENIVMKCNSYTIVRIGNITWGNNPNTLLNYLKAHPEAEKRDEIRYLVDKEEFLHWMDKIRPNTKDIMNITGRMVNVKDL